MLLYSIKNFLKNFKPSIIRKRFFLTRKLRPYVKEVEKELTSTGYHKLKIYNINTWKFYGVDKNRFTLLGYKDSKKYVIKATKGFDEKTNNSIYFQLHFNDIFDFIPKGGEIVVKGYKCYFTEFIDSMSFSSALKQAKENAQFDFYLEQANNILDELNKYKIVHCNLEEVNILVDKKTNKLFLIDWDTICSTQLGLNCLAFPYKTIKKKIHDKKFVYDDAYSFWYCLKGI